jgi:hypothetical protein
MSACDFSEFFSHHARESLRDNYCSELRRGNKRKGSKRALSFLHHVVRQLFAGWCRRRSLVTASRSWGRCRLLVTAWSRGRSWGRSWGRSRCRGRGLLLLLAADCQCQRKNHYQGKHYSQKFLHSIHLLSYVKLSESLFVSRPNISNINTLFIFCQYKNCSGPALHQI